MWGAQTSGKENSHLAGVGWIHESACFGLAWRLVRDCACTCVEMVLRAQYIPNPKQANPVSYVKFSPPPPPPNQTHTPQQKQQQQNTSWPVICGLFDNTGWPSTISSAPVTGYAPYLSFSNEPWMNCVPPHTCTLQRVSELRRCVHYGPCAGYLIPHNNLELASMHGRR